MSTLRPLRATSETAVYPFWESREVSTAGRSWLRSRTTECRMEGVTWLTGEVIKRDLPSAVRLGTYADVAVHYLKDRVDRGPGVIRTIAKQNSGKL